MSHYRKLSLIWSLEPLNGFEVAWEFSSCLFLHNFFYVKEDNVSRYESDQRIMIVITLTSLVFLLVATYITIVFHKIFLAPLSNKKNIVLTYNEIQSKGKPLLFETRLKVNSLPDRKPILVCVKQILHRLIFHWIFRGM